MSVLSNEMISERRDFTSVGVEIRLRDRVSAVKKWILLRLREPRLDYNEEKDE